MENILRNKKRKIFKEYKKLFCIKVTAATVVGYLALFANISKSKLANHKLARLLSFDISKLIKFNVQGSLAAKVPSTNNVEEST